MRFTTFLLVPVALLPTLVIAADQGETQCTYHSLVRRVVILSEPGVSVPCEVHYFKDSEAAGEGRVLWRADSQEGYCEERAAELVAKLEGWGWQCTAGAAAPEEPATPDAPTVPEQPAEPEPPMESADDTEDLVPVEDT